MKHEDIQSHINPIRIFQGYDIVHTCIRNHKDFLRRSWLQVHALQWWTSNSLLHAAIVWVCSYLTPGTLNPWKCTFWHWWLRIPPSSARERIFCRITAEFYEKSQKCTEFETFFISVHFLVYKLSFLVYNNPVRKPPPIMNFDTDYPILQDIASRVIASFPNTDDIPGFTVMAEINQSFPAYSESERLELVFEVWEILYCKWKKCRSHNFFIYKQSFSVYNNSVRKPPQYVKSR